MDFVKHPLIRDETTQHREYQDSILRTALESNTLCVLPTGLGKTNIALLLTARRLEKFPESKILIMAPTRPLVNQHYRTFEKALNINKEKMQVLTGVVKPSLREGAYKEKTVIFATPQTIQNDIKEGRLSLKDFSLVVLDEIHHAIGRYAYEYISRHYLETARNQRILGLTASPGSEREKISEVCKNCGIEAVEIRTEKDTDVAGYVKSKGIEWLYVELPESFKKIQSLIREEYKNRVDSLKKMGFLRSGRVSKKELLDLQNSLGRSIREGYKKAMMGITIVSQAIKLEHALVLLETQGITILEKYWKKIRSGTSGADKKISNNKNISRAMWLTHNLFESGSRHPKMSKLCSVIENQLREKTDSKIIVFANFRETVKEIVSILNKLDNVKAIDFIGQREGITQKEQAKRLSDFRDSLYNILACTSIGEEGLDIPSMDLAVFYEPVPSAIRSIQRRGRVGRQKTGRIIILITKSTRDEAYLWSSMKKERAMHKTLYGMKAENTLGVF